MQKVLLSVAVVLVGSLAVAATIFLKFSPHEEVKALDTIPTPTAAVTATCQTGFDRPLLFGVSGDGSPSNYEGDLKRAGSTTAGIGIHWDNIQPNGPQDYDPEMVNFPIRKASQSGLVIVVNLSGTPRWASDDGDMEARKALPNKANDVVVREFKELITQAVRDNKDKAKYWSYGNEPNGCGSNTGSCGYTHDSAEDYAYWFNIFYQTIKAADPDAKVILGPLEFTKDDTSYISLMNDMVPNYDYLGVTLYDKNPHKPIPIDWAQHAYDRQRNKKPLFVTEWGFDTKWGCDDNDKSCVTSARQEIAGLIDQSFQKLYAANYIFAAKYHNLRDGGSDGSYGIWEKDGPRPGGTKFLEISQQKCNASFSQGGGSSPVVAPSNQPITNGEVPITIRTYYSSDVAQNQWPHITVYLNNAADFDPAGPYDRGKCDGSYHGAAGTDLCGNLNTYTNKLVDSFDATGTSYKDMTINASKLVPNLTTGVGNTKISYAYSNDPTTEGDRNFRITKIEVYGPATDNSNQSKLLKTFTPSQSDSYFGGYAADTTRELNSFYFDMGTIETDGTVNANNNGMVKGFDKAELKTIKQAGSHEAGTWEMKQEGTFNFVSVELQKIIKATYNINSSPGACVIESHDIGGNLLKRNQPLTLTSVASAAVNKFTYTFYNRDNKDSKGIPRVVCVAGLAAGGDCPTGSGPLIANIDGSNNRDGAMQAASWLKTPNGKVIDSVWRGDMGWNRILSLDTNFGQASGTPWNFSSYLGVSIISPDLSNSEIDALDFYNTSNKSGAMEVWRNNRLSMTTFNYNGEGSYPDWATSKTHEVIDLNKNNAYPGTGVVTADASIVAGNTLWQVIWRGNQELIRSLPTSSATGDTSKYKFSVSRDASSLPVPNVKVQALNYMTMPDGKVQEQIWLNDQVYKRTISIVNGAPDFAHATQYQKLGDAKSFTQPSDLSNSTTFNYNQIHVIDARTGKMLENVQVNATFDTANGHIADDGKCVVRFAFDKIDGDANGDCVNDIYDYNVLLQYYGTTNCSYNVTGDCKIDDADLKFLKDRFGNKCS